MKNIKKIAAKVVKESAVSELKRNANSATCGAFFQPKAPAGLTQFKKAAK
ncbi:MAG: cyclic lactone autoinducer peptide [Oscillospiraceae bacterium]|nr:cyclic lactone autoinducer peptide [Oscillospiraceae bacterium]